MPDYCNNCLPWPVRELIFFPSDGGAPAECCLLQEDDGTSLLLEDGSGCLQPENC